MRCRNCNVDLPEYYTACPLCGSKTHDDAPLIEGIKTAEFPKVKTQPYKRNPFPIFFGIWVIATLVFAILSKFEIVSDTASAIVFCAIPCVWTVLLRPLMVEQLYVGNYIVMNFYPFALACATFCYLESGSVSESLPIFVERFLPACLLAVLIALTVLILIRPKDKKRAAAYSVLMLIPSIICLIVLSITEKIVFGSWIAVIALCVLILVFLFATKPQETKDELAAKFSIQKSLKKHK